MDICISRYMSHMWECRFPPILKKEVLWRDLYRDRAGVGRVFSPPRHSATGWHAAPAVRRVQGKHIHSTHHTNPSITSSNPLTSSLLSLEEGLQLCWKPIAGLAKTLKNECIFLLCSGGGYQTVFLRHQNSFHFVEERTLVEEVSQRREPMKDEETIRCSFCFINACEEKQEIHFIFIFIFLSLVIC